LRSVNVCRPLGTRVDKPQADMYNRGSILLLRESAKSLETDGLALCHLCCVTTATLAKVMNITARGAILGLWGH